MNSKRLVSNENEIFRTGTKFSNSGRKRIMSTSPSYRVVLGQTASGGSNGDVPELVCSNSIVSSKTKSPPLNRRRRRTTTNDIIEPPFIDTKKSLDFKNSASNGDEGISYLKLLFGEVEYLTVASCLTYFLVVYFTLPFKALVALSLCTATTILFWKTITDLAATYTRQQWRLIQRNGLVVYMPESLKKFVDPQQGKSLHDVLSVASPSH